MTSDQAEQIIRTIKLIAMNDRFGYGIGAWGTHLLAISSIYSHLYFLMCSMWSLNVIPVSRLKANGFLIQLALIKLILHLLWYTPTCGDHPRYPLSLVIDGLLFLSTIVLE